MPACKDCCWFDGDHCKMSKNDHHSAVVACKFAILNKHLPFFCGNLLEVGCGKHPVRRAVSRYATWHGIDPNRQSNAGLRLVRGSVVDMPYKDNSFDWVLALSTIEHWKDDILSGLKEIHRVLKVGGSFVVEVPFHNHGSDMFYFGNQDDFRNICNSIHWSSIQFEEWRKEYKPLQPLRDWMTLTDRASMVKYENGELPSQWSLEVYAVK